MKSGMQTSEKLTVLKNVHGRSWIQVGCTIGQREDVLVDIHFTLLCIQPMPYEFSHNAQT